MPHVNILLVYASFIGALLCQLFPWEATGTILRPDFLLVIMLYWVLRAPNLCNVGTAWFIGLLVDLATGSLLGQHALSFTLTAFLGLIYQRRLVLFSPIQLAGYIFVLLVFERIVMIVLKLFVGNDYPGLAYFWPVLTGLLLWQLMIVMFGSLARPKTN